MMKLFKSPLQKMNKYECKIVIVIQYNSRPELLSED